MPHEAILDALRKQDISENVVNYFRIMYGSAQTTFKNCGGFNVRLRRGVKQGNPLSPLLFNLVVNPMLDGLNEMDGAFEVDGVKMGALAFADDLVLLFDSEEALQSALGRVAEELGRVDLKLSPGKCGVFSVKKWRKTWIKPEINLVLNDQRLRNFGTEEDIYI